MKIWRLSIAYWILKTTTKLSGNVLFIAFPLQQCLHDRAQFWVIGT